MCNDVCNIFLGSEKYIYICREKIKCEGMLTLIVTDEKYMSAFFLSLQLFCRFFNINDRKKKKCYV